MASKLAEYVLSEFSSDSSAMDERVRMFKDLYLFVNKEHAQKCAFVGDILDSPNQMNRRFLQIYTLQDRRRKLQWYNDNPELALKQNSIHLKQLIAKNFTRPRGFVRERTNEDELLK